MSGTAGPSCRVTDRSAGRVSPVASRCRGSRPSGSRRGLRLRHRRGGLLWFQRPVLSRRAESTPSSQHRSSAISDPRINERIRVPEVRLVGPNGEQAGIVRIEDALRLAAEADLDLVEVAPTAKPPVCKLMDFGKYKYEAAVKARESRKNQVNTVLKEVRFRLKIDTHDYETKTGHAKKFLGQGDKVKAIIQFRGREQQRPELGIKLLHKFAEDVADLGSVESQPRQDGRNMVMVIGPHKTKAEARAEQRKDSGEGHRERADGGSRRDQAAREARAAAEKKAKENAAPVSNSVGDAFPEELRRLAAEPRTTPSAPAVEAPEAPASQAPSESVKAPAPQARPAAQERPARPQAAPRPQSAPRSAEPRRGAAPTSESAPRPAAQPSAPAPVTQPASAPKPAAAPKPVAAPKPGAPKPGAVRPMPTPPKPGVPRGGAPKPGAKGA